MPRAVPGCAAVLMIPEAVPRAATGTLVPSLVAATEDSPMPAPPSLHRPQAPVPGAGPGRRLARIAWHV
jgi:hypothetical protein